MQGYINSVAGSNTSGSTYISTPAAQAQFSLPSGLAFDSTGNLYISDGGTVYILGATPDDMVTPYAGNPSGNTPGPPTGTDPLDSYLGIATGIAFDSQ